MSAPLVIGLCCRWTPGGQH